jgi:hypothetical protein
MRQLRLSLTTAQVASLQFAALGRGCVKTPDFGGYIAGSAEYLFPMLFFPYPPPEIRYSAYIC